MPLLLTALSSPLQTSKTYNHNKHKKIKKIHKASKNNRKALTHKQKPPSDLWVLVRLDKDAPTRQEPGRDRSLFPDLGIIAISAFWKIRG